MNADIVARIIREEDKANEEIVYDGFTHRQLDAAFALVANPENWKLEIDQWINDSPENRRLVGAATIFFAGSPAEFMVSATKPGMVRVIAAGYYACIGA